MTSVKSGDKVSVEYTGRFADGMVFDSSEGRDPLKFTVGANEVIPGFDKAVTGLSTGESVTIQIPPAEAYGLHDANLIVTLDRSKIPPEVEIGIGSQLQMKNEEGRIFSVAVTGLSEEEVIVDANHPLAGKELTFDIKLVEICE